MLSTLIRHFPPLDEAHGPTVSEIPGVYSVPSQLCSKGELTVHCHEFFDHPQWLTGVRIDIPRDQEVKLDITSARLTLRSTTSTSKTKYAIADCYADSQWLQRLNSWRAFPWTIPAPFARSIGLSLEIVLVYTANAPVDIGVSISYARLPEIPRDDSFLFVDEDGHIAHAWDGVQETDETMDRGKGTLIHPNTKTRFRILPPFSCLHEWYPKFTDEEGFCSPLNWDQYVPMVWRY